MHTSTSARTRKHRQVVFGLAHVNIIKYSQTHPDALAQAHEHAHSNAFAVSVLTDK